MPSISLEAVFRNSLLAQAAYALFTTPQQAQSAVQDPRSANATGEVGRREFVHLDPAGFELVHHQPDLITGLSATVFRDRSTGGLILSVRGTTGPMDLIEDVGRIGLQGIAGSQLLFTGITGN
jgi:hypothetical protein